jgi:hypothetical protein
LYRLESGSLPSQHAQVEVEDGSWVAAGHQDRKVRHDAEHKERQLQESQDHKVGIASSHFIYHSLIRYSATAASAALLVLLAGGCAWTTGGTLPSGVPTAGTVVNGRAFEALVAKLMGSRAGPLTGGWVL